MATQVSDVTATPPVERQIVTDISRRAAIVAPALVVIGAIGWGVHGALSVLAGLVIVLVNYALSAAILSRSDKWSPAAVMSAVMVGFVVRMALVLAAITVAGHVSWITKWPFGITIVATHLGLLVWEAKYLSISLAFPALKPSGDK